MFIRVLVEYMPPSWDLTGDLFFIFTVPLSQLMVLAITGTLAWFFPWPPTPAKAYYLLGMLDDCPRAAFLFRIHNPVEDVFNLFGMDRIVVRR